MQERNEFLMSIALGLPDRRYLRSIENCVYFEQNIDALMNYGLIRDVGVLTLHIYEFVMSSELVDALGFPGQNGQGIALVWYPDPETHVCRFKQPMTPP